MKPKKLLVLLLVLAFWAANSLAADKYEIDPVHSNIGFTVRHMVIAKVTGRFKDVSGVIFYDEGDITRSSVNVRIKVVSIDTDNETRDNHLRSADFFDAENYPEITFASKRIEKEGDGYVAIGDLTIRGVTKEIALPFRFLGKVKDPRGNTRVGFEAETTLNRFDYGVKWDKTLETGGLIVSKEVQVELAVEAVAAPKEPPANR